MLRPFLVLSFMVWLSTAASAEMLPGNSYIGRGSSVSYNCSGAQMPMDRKNFVGLFRSNESDVYVYFGNDVGVKLSYAKAKSGSDAASTVVSEGGNRFRDSAQLQIRGDKAIVTMMAENLTGSGKFSSSYVLEIGGASCQTISYQPKNLCGASGVKVGHRDAAPQSCDVRQGAPRF